MIRVRVPAGLLAVKSAKPGRKVTVTVTITSGDRKLASARVKSKVTK